MLAPGLCWLCACAAPGLPPELVSAREAFRRVTALPPARVPLEELADARRLLDRAEQAFAEEPTAATTRDLAYLALRQAELVESEAIGQASSHALGRLRRKQTEREARQRRKRDAELRRAAQQQARERALREKARAAARERMDRVLAELRELGELHEEGGRFHLEIVERRVFAHRRPWLRADAKPRLQQLARVLRGLDRAAFVVKVFVVQHGPSPRRLRWLALRRADRVRSVLVAAGLPPERVRAAAGRLGQRSAARGDQPRRANEGHLEILIEPSASPPGVPDVYTGLLAR